MVRRVLAALEVGRAVARVLLRGALDLDRRVRDAVAEQKVLRLVQHGVRVVRDQVHAERWEARAERPDVQVVGREHGRQRAQAVLDLLGVDAVRRALHEHVHALLHDADGRAQHEQREDERRDRVRDLPRRVVPDQAAGDAHAHALDEIAQRVDVRGLDVEVLELQLLLVRWLLRGLLGAAVLQVRAVRVAVSVAVRVAVVVFLSTTVTVAVVLLLRSTVRVAVVVSTMRVAVAAAAAVAVAVTQDLHQDQVHQQPNARDDEHELAVHALLRVRLETLHEALNRGVHEHAREHPDDEHARDRADDLSALEAKAQARGRRQRRGPDREQRDAEARDVREQVRGVRHDRERAREEAADDLRDHEEQRAGARELQLALRALGGRVQRDAAVRVRAAEAAGRCGLERRGLVRRRRRAAVAVAVAVSSHLVRRVVLSKLAAELASEAEAGAEAEAEQVQRGTYRRRAGVAWRAALGMRAEEAAAVGEGAAHVGASGGEGALLLALIS